MLERIKKSLEERNIKGTILTETLQIVDDIFSVGGHVSEEAYAILYYATSTEHYRQIFEGKISHQKDTNALFSTKKNGEIQKHGEVILEIRIPVEKITISAKLTDEFHFKIK